jgi:site-specific recombinase XerD
LNEIVAFDSLQTAITAFVGNQLSDATRVAYRYDLKKWFDWYGWQPTCPTVSQAVEFRQYLEQIFKTRTAARIFNTVRTFYRFVGGFNPFQNVKSPKAVVNRTPEVPDDQTVAKMLDLVDNPRDRLILVLMLNGLRRAEVAGVKRADISWLPDYGRDIIKVIGKGNKERLVPATLETSLALRNYPGDSEYLFQDGDGHISVRVIEWVSEKWSKAAGRNLSPHKWRHHYATRLVRAKAPILQVSKLLGHASVSTTQIYVNLDLADVVDAANLDPMNRRMITVE